MRFYPVPNQVLSGYVTEMAWPTHGLCEPSLISSVDVCAGKYGDLDSSVISYGPCQTPTLGLCVDRHDKILHFKPQKFWTVAAKVRAGPKILSLEWSRVRVFDIEVGTVFLKMIGGESKAKVTSVTHKSKSKPRPTALNTVELMRSCSSGLGMGPQHVMTVAERLYIQGYIS